MKARKRITHEQLDLAFRRDKNGGRRGGSRPGAGRPRKLRAGSRHQTRPTLKRRFPVHVVLRVHRDFRNLRKRHMYRALREATVTVLRRELHDAVAGAFRIVHISIQQRHVHLLVEADHKMALSRGMQCFQISAAKHLNRALSEAQELPERRRGAVFPDRFHQEIITTPTRARHALSYVLNNWRKHREDASGRAATWKLDPFSTAVTFPDWKEREAEPFLWPWRDTYDPLCVYVPKTWLLREGWKTAGSISCFDVPSAPKDRRRARRSQPSEIGMASGRA